MIPLLLCSLSALAFAPSDDVFVGQEPVRTWRFHPERQYALRHGPAWQAFLEGDGAGWQGRFDERAGTVHRAWGRGIDLGLAADATADEVSSGVLGFLSRNPDLLGVDVGLLRPRSAGQSEQSGTWFIGFDRVVEVDDGPDGTPVPLWRGGIEARVRDGRLVLFGIDSHPQADALSGVTPVLSAETALEVAISYGPAGNSPHTIEGGSLVVLPVESGSGLDYRLCWLTRTRTADPVGIWMSFVDAMTGELIAVYNEVRFASGTLYGQHDTRTVNGDMSVSPISYANLQNDAFSDTTDGEGAWELGGGEGALSTTLSGRYFLVRNRGAGGDGSMSWDEGDATWTTDDATQAEIDSYIFLSQVREWAEGYAPEVSLTSSKITSNVNLNSTCNAYFDGDVNFYEAGGGCNNTGRIADVNYHEWGHGFHYYSLESGTFDGSISEGIGDTVSFMMTGDSRIAPYFTTGGSAIRDVADDRVYPDDWVYEVHYDGLIFAGAVWDLWDALEDDLSQEEAYDTMVTLFVEAIKAGPEIPDSYDEFVAADDDNGDLSDGTPNQCAIIEAFSKHGLGPVGGSSLIGVQHEPLSNQPVGSNGYTITADVVNLAPECVEFSVSNSLVHYSVDGGESWQTTPLALSGTDTVKGEIPAQDDGSVVLYYLSATGDDGTEATVPSGGDINPFTFFVGDLVELYCEDFESDDGGYTHELIDGSVTEGADDWMHGTPLGMGGDPDFAFSGDNLWGNDLGGGNYNGEYQDDKQNRLSSPEIDVSGFDSVVVQYQRWLNVEDGYYDQANVLIDDEVVWSNHATDRNVGDEHTQDEQWSLQTHLADPTGDSIVLAWEIDTDGGLTMGGWNIDDVCVYGFVADSGTGDGGGSDGGSEVGDGGDAGDGGSGADPADEDDWEALACGCATGQGSAPAGGLLAVLLSMVVGARRRERRLR